MERKTVPQVPSRGFTLIELLVVITVIAILAGIVLNTAGYMQRKAAWSRAEAEIAALSAALESYKVEYGTYPTGTNLTGANPAVATNNSFLRTALGGGATSNNSLGKVFFEFPAGMAASGVAATGSTPVLDPFGNGYGYQFPGNATRSGTNFFDLWSTGGATPATDSNQWIKNW
jgi:general secretion pathway protein G